MRRVLKPTVDFNIENISVNEYVSIKELTKRFAQKYDVKTSELECFNGIEALIDSFFLDIVFDKQIENVYIYAPAFKYFTHVAKKFCKSIKQINRFETLDFEIAKDSVVIFTNPCKPDGKYYHLDKLFEMWKEKNCTILMDEAFIDYCNMPSQSQYINSYDKLYVIKSMQRFYAMSGLKLATLISSKSNIQKLKKHQPKHRLSTLDSAYCLQVLKDKNFKRINQAVNVKNMRLLQEVLQCTGLIEKIYESNSNMLLCQLKKIKAKAFIKKFGCHGIDMKSCEHFMFLDEYHVRFTIWHEDDIHILVRQFQKAYEN